MLGLDDRIAGLSTGASVAMALVVALLLGLRHATDPDHLTAVSTLVLGDDEHGAREARRLGFAWGLGHATTLIALGMPVVLFHRFLPDAVQRAAEMTIGVVIAGLAVRLLVRWHRGCFHAHVHTHGEVIHAHPHVHEEAHDAHGHAHPHPPAHEHRHEALGRSPRTSYGIGLVHGTGGSAGVGILLIGAIPGHAVAAVALFLFASATAVSMALVSTAWGLALSRGAVAQRLSALAPAFGTLSLAFGLWYGVTAMA